MRLPRTLFGRLLLVLASGLLVAQLLSAAINLAERDRLLSSSFGMQPAQRVADVVHLIDGMDAAQRQALLAVFRTPPLVLSLHAAPLIAEDATMGWHAQMFASRLQSALGDTRAVRVQPRDGFAPPTASDDRDARRNARMGTGMGMGPGVGMGGAPVSYTHLDVYKRQAIRNAIRLMRVLRQIRLPFHLTILLPPKWPAVNTL